MIPMNDNVMKVFLSICATSENDSFTFYLSFRIGFGKLPCKYIPVLIDQFCLAMGPNVLTQI